MTKSGDSERIYWQKVGWTAHVFGLPSTTTDQELLSHVRRARAQALNLPEDSPWFEIFCGDLKRGLQPEFPQLGDENWDFDDWQFHVTDDNLEDPRDALDAARRAYIALCKD